MRLICLGCRLKDQIQPKHKMTITCTKNGCTSLIKSNLEEVFRSTGKRPWTEKTFAIFSTTNSASLMTSSWIGSQIQILKKGKVPKILNCLSRIYNFFNTSLADDLNLEEWLLGFSVFLKGW